MSTLSTIGRNASVAAVANLFDAGAGPGDIALRDDTTIVAVVVLADPAWSSPTTGVCTGNGFPRSDSSADNSGVIDNYQGRDSDGNVIVSGVVGETGSGEDIELNNTNVTAGQSVELTTATLTQPAS